MKKSILFLFVSILAVFLSVDLRAAIITTDLSSNDAYLGDVSIQINPYTGIPYLSSEGISLRGDTEKVITTSSNYKITLQPIYEGSIIDSSLFVPPDIPLGPKRVGGYFGFQYINESSVYYGYAETGVNYWFAPRFLNVSFNTTEGQSITVIPEPSTYALYGLGAIGMLIALRRKKTA